MKTLGLGLVLALTVSRFAEAGGISFGPSYAGTHPTSGDRVELKITNGGIVDGTPKPAVLTVHDSLGSASDLKLHQASRNEFEAIFELRRADQVIARVVTTGDCQHVDKAALVFASGVSLTLASE